MKYGVFLFASYPSRFLRKCRGPLKHSQPTCRRSEVFLQSRLSLTPRCSQIDALTRKARERLALWSGVRLLLCRRGMHCTGMLARLPEESLERKLRGYTSFRNFSTCRLCGCVVEVQSIEIPCLEMIVYLLSRVWSCLLRKYFRERSGHLFT